MITQMIKFVNNFVIILKQPYEFTLTKTLENSYNPKWMLLQH